MTSTFRSVAMTAAIMGFAASGAWAQEAPKAGGAAPAGGAPAAHAPAGGGGDAAGGQGELLQPKGGPSTGVPDAKVSPGMKANTNPATPPAPGAKQSGENVGVPPAANEPPKAAPSPKAGETPKAQNAPGTDGQKPGKPAQGAAAKPAPRLSGDQEKHVQQAFRGVHAAPVRVDFHVGVGVAIPRTVVIEALPPEIITYVPEYEGFRYFVTPGEIVIVDPDTLEIVAVLPL